MTSSLKKKIGKGILTLAAFFGLISPTEIKLSAWAVVGLVSAVIVLVMYRYYLGIAYDNYNKLKGFFLAQSKDIKYIRSKIEEDKNDGNKR